MKIGEAVKILEDLKSKLPIRKQDERVWRTQALSHLKLFFGNDSHEHKFMLGFSFDSSSEGYRSDYWREFVVSKKRNSNDKQQEAYCFLEACIESLKAKGLYRLPNGNFLSKFSNAQIWASIFTLGPIILGFCYFLGKMHGEIRMERVEFELQKCKESLNKQPVIR